MKKKLDARGNLHRLHEILEEEAKQVEEGDGEEAHEEEEANNMATI
jgi:hypothetical protein